MSSRILIFGTGGHAKVAIDVLQLSGYETHGLVDKDHEHTNEIINGVPIIGADTDTSILSMIQSGSVEYFVAIGENATRRKVTEQAQTLTKKNPVNAIHPDALISRFASLGYGNFIQCGVKINAGAVIHDHTIINTSATIDHDVVLASYAQVCPGVNVAGYVHIGEDAFIGTGAVILPNITIQEHAVVGAGAVVIRDVRSRSTVVGNPARATRL